MKKKKHNYLFIVTLVFFGIFLAIYFSYRGGYYEVKAHNKMVLTEEAMKRFEEDVSSGKDISINNYIESDYKDYSNRVTEAGVKIGKLTEDFVVEGIGAVFKVLGKLFLGNKRNSILLLTKSLS